MSTWLTSVSPLSPLLPPLVRVYSLFRHLSSFELRRRTRQALRSDFAFGVAIKDGEVSIIEDVDGGGVTRGDLARPRGFAEMIRPYASKLPDMKFAINALAEVCPTLSLVSYACSSFN